MEHNYVERNDIADRYVMGKLAAFERNEFEEHFIGCNPCVQTLREIQIVRRALEIAGPDAVQDSRWNLWAGLGVLIPSFTRLQALTVVTMLLVLIGVPVFFLLSENLRLQEQHDQVVALNRSLSEDIQKRDTENSDSNQNRAPSRVNRNGDEPATTKPRSHPGGRQRVFQPKEPVPNTPVFSLSAGTRGPQETESNTIVVSPSAPFFTIVLDLEGSSTYKKYRVRIRSENGAWLPPHRDFLYPDRNRRLTISFLRRFLQPGNYVLVLEGSEGASDFVSIANYPFSVVRG